MFVFLKLEWDTRSCPIARTQTRCFDFKLGRKSIVISIVIVYSFIEENPAAGQRLGRTPDQDHGERPSSARRRHEIINFNFSVVHTHAAETDSTDGKLMLLIWIVTDF